jgi:uncharacterized membrane protein
MRSDGHMIKRIAVSGTGPSQGESAALGVTPGQDAHSRSLLKAVSWRLTGTLDTFVIGFIVTGKVSIAGSIAATELFSKILLYYGHERMWALIQWGRF